MSKLRNDVKRLQTNLRFLQSYLRFVASQRGVQDTKSIYVVRHALTLIDDYLVNGNALTLMDIALVVDDSQKKASRPTKSELTSMYIANEIYKILENREGVNSFE